MKMLSFILVFSCSYFGLTQSDFSCSSESIEKITELEAVSYYMKKIFKDKFENNIQTDIVFNSSVLLKGRRKEFILFFENTEKEEYYLTIFKYDKNKEQEKVAYSRLEKGVSVKLIYSKYFKRYYIESIEKLKISAVRW